MVELGYARTTTTKVAARAGVSVGSLYQYFPSKDALVGALIERKFAGVMATMQAAEQASRGAGLEQRVRAIIGGVLETKAERPELGAVLAEQIPNTGGINYKAAMTGAAVELVVSMLREHEDQIEVEDLRLAAYISVQAVEGVIGAAALDRFGVDGRPPSTRGSGPDGDGLHQAEACSPERSRSGPSSGSRPMKSR